MSKPRLAAKTMDRLRVKAGNEVSMQPRDELQALTPRQRFIAALERRPLVGRVPTFELDFFLTMEALGKVLPQHRRFEQWNQMEEKERRLQRADAAEVFIHIAEKYEHDAIFIHPTPGLGEDETCRLIDVIREKTGERYFLMLHGDATFDIPDGGHMAEFSYRMADDPEGLKREAQERIELAFACGERYMKHGGLDGFALCSDYCLNTGPFLSPRRFSEFVTPYLARLVQAYREMGFYTIKHTDGNIMPIIDQLVQANPHALHSLDPQAGVDIAEVKRRFGKQVCLIGNVHCGLLDTGTDDEVIASARYALENGMPGGGYIFSTSNCVYTGMPLRRYELMLEVWRQYAYPEIV